MYVDSLGREASWLVSTVGKSPIRAVARLFARKAIT